MSVTVGQPAPAFTLPTEDGQVSLADYRGRRLVLYFYPKDDTSGCTSEAVSFRDHLKDYEGLNAAILGVSRDTAASHAKFRAKYGLTFPLAADIDGTVCDAYGVWKEKSMYGKTYMGIERTTVLIDETGTVRELWRKVKVAGHSDAIIAAIKGL
jgi:peroxiredoxin